MGIRAILGKFESGNFLKDACDIPNARQKGFLEKYKAFVE